MLPLDSSVIAQAPLNTCADITLSRASPRRSPRGESTTRRWIRRNDIRSHSSSTAHEAAFSCQSSGIRRRVLSFLFSCRPLHVRSPVTVHYYHHQHHHNAPLLQVTLPSHAFQLHPLRLNFPLSRPLATALLAVEFYPLLHSCISMKHRRPAACILDVDGYAFSYLTRDAAQRCGLR